MDPKQKSIRFFIMMFEAFLARVSPVSTIANPACMKNTRKAAISVHMTLMAVCVVNTLALTSSISEADGATASSPITCPANPTHSAKRKIAVITLVPALIVTPLVNAHHVHECLTIQQQPCQPDGNNH